MTARDQSLRLRDRWLWLAKTYDDLYQYRASAAARDEADDVWIAPKSRPDAVQCIDGVARGERRCLNAAIDGRELCASHIPGYRKPVVKDPVVVAIAPPAPPKIRFWLDLPDVVPVVPVTICEAPSYSDHVLTQTIERQAARRLRDAYSWNRRPARRYEGLA